MKLLGYSERGLINALLYEIAFRDAFEAQKLLAELFHLGQWPMDKPPPGFFDKCATTLVEQSFSDFGDADALFLFEFGKAGGAVFFEGKREKQYTLRKAWKVFIEAFRGNVRAKGLTSSLLCQLYFKQRLVNALSPGSGEDVRTGLLFEAPLDRRGGIARKIGKNPVVWHSVGMLKKHLGEVYYLMMIPERWSQDVEAWWKNQVATASPAPAGWNLSRWGAITIPDIVDFCNAKGLNRTLDVIRHNAGQLYREPVPLGAADWKNRNRRGLSLIYAPATNPHTCLHFFWVGEGCALRDYSEPTLMKPPEPDRSRTTSDVLRLITKEVPRSTRELDNGEIEKWRDIIEKQNRVWEIGASAPPAS